MISHTRIFETETEAIAFADGVEFVGDTSYEVESIELEPDYSNNIVRWVVLVNDYVLDEV